MTINERVSDERIANLIEVLSFYSPEDKRLANNESDLASALRELQQCRAAAEPVGEVVLGDYDDCGDYPDAKVVCIAEQGQADWNNFRNGTKLYAAPQVTSVPDESAIFDAAIDICRKSDAIDEHAWNRGVLAVMSAFKACRAAIASGKSPVIPDGWIPVSERMPEPKSERRVCVYTPTPHEDMRYRFVPASLFKTVCSSATHWYYMEPPVEPKQEAE
ncbi:hypothetical protein [Atlantibacter hermannii]|uniref:hypothetical protein n=1 Tax=Atlantibacter hermannii TaxID=565 RepID=UPI0028987E53|nr:hypothetical protein [Atlantibacter hermannii]